MMPSLKKKEVRDLCYFQSNYLKDYAGDNF